MLRVFSIVLGFACVSLMITACSDDTPATPTPVSAALGVDGSTLKVNAPTPVSPTNGAVLNTLKPTFEVTAASGQYVSPTVSFSYGFEVQTESGSLVRAETLPGTSWAFPDNLANDTPYRWRARAVRSSAFGPWSALQSFRTQSLPGCVDGVLSDPRAYFFFLIGRTEGSSARDWESVLRNSGLPAGPVEGARIPGNAPFYGLTQQISSSGTLRGRVFLPTNSPSAYNYYIQDVDVLSDPSGTTWVWRPFGAPPYAPRPCP